MILKIAKTILIGLLIIIPLNLMLRPTRTTEIKGFSLEAIASVGSFNSEWEPNEPTSIQWTEVDRALSQPYRYLGSGGQCFTFVSSDNQYVIKFFKQKQFAIPSWIDHFPIPFMVGCLKERKVLKKEMKRAKVFSAFKRCFDDFPEETGLLYIHLNQTKKLKKTLDLTDAKKQFHSLNLDDLEFVIQRKAELAYNAIDAFMAKGQIEQAKTAIDQLLKLNIGFYQKGMRNRDANFRSNCGFLGSKAIMIDVGRVVYSEEIKKPENYTKELIQITPRFRKYLLSEHPELIDYFDRSIHKFTSLESSKGVDKILGCDE